MMGLKPIEHTGTDIYLKCPECGEMYEMPVEVYRDDVPPEFYVWQPGDWRCPDCKGKDAVDVTESQP